MKKTIIALLGLISLFACAETPVKKDPSPDSSSSGTAAPVRAPQKRTFFYRVEAAAQMVGFNVLVNGTEVYVSEGAKPSELKTTINDWMISGINEISFSIFWPDSVKFAPGYGASALFKLFSNDTLLKEFTWPIASKPDQANSYPYTFTEMFKADGFPKVALERAERVISSAGVLPKSDQEVIAGMATELRKAFTGKDIAVINELFKNKYADLAVARFTTAAAIREEISSQYLELFQKDSYTVRPPGSRFFYSSTADDRVVQVRQGRIGFQEAALVITWKEKGAAKRFDQELYFSKIDGKWVIIR
jgi:hypothetical protein